MDIPIPLPQKKTPRVGYKTLEYLKNISQARSNDLGDEYNLEISEIYDFASYEVAAGESEHNEVELALDALDDLTESNKT